MSARRSEERLAEAAKLYYVDDLNQEQVAAALGTTRSNVSRMLRAARRQGIIKFNVTYPLTRQATLEQRLLRTFRVSEAVVLEADIDDDVLERTGELAARWLVEQVSDGQTIALSWGRTLKAIAAQLEPDRAYDVHLVQLGGDLHIDPGVTGIELVRDVATRFGGQYSYLHAPALLNSTQAVADLRASPDIAEQMNKAREADVALIGLGGAEDGYLTHLVHMAQLTEAEQRELAAADPAGDIVGRFFDDNGHEVGPLQGRVLALELDEIKEIPVVAAVASGPQKARSVWAALRGGLIDVIICDQSAASAALHMERESL